jgi:hypothetical protein
MRTLFWSMAAFFALASLLCLAGVTWIVLHLRRQRRERRIGVDPVRPYRR